MIENIGPTIYNGESIYNTGAGGGGGGGGEQTVTIGGVEHKVKKINNLIWLVENLKAPFNFVHNGKPNTNAYFTYDYGDGRIDYLYNLAAKQYLYNNPDLLNGFRIPKKTDLDNLIYYADPTGYNGKPGYYLKSEQEWIYNSSNYGVNILGFNLLPSCYSDWNYDASELTYTYNKSTTTFYIGNSNYGARCESSLRTVSYQNTFGIDNYRGYVIRLCKDV